MSQWRYVGYIFKKYLLDQFTSSYDLIINFIQGHEEADKVMQSTIMKEEFVNLIIAEQSIYVQIAEDYVKVHIVKLFPEICKSIQLHRAEYYLLIHEFHFINKMLKNG